MESMLQSRDGK